MSASTISTWVPFLGFLLALLFGAVAHRTGFCTMGAISDVVLFGDRQRLRMWVLAAAAATLGAQSMHLAGIVDLDRTLYTVPRLAWLSHLTGGFLFGMGMTLASGCGSRNLIRLGAGNLKSLVVLLVLGLTAYMTLKGILALPRVYLLDAVSIRLATPQDLPSILGAGTRIPLAVVVVGGTILWCLRDAAFRRARGYVAGSLAIGAVVAAGWYVTGHLGFVPEDPDTLEELFAGTNSRRPESFTYVGPAAYALELLMLWTDSSLRVTFGIAIVAGTLVGATVHALWRREFRWEIFASAGDFRNHVVGGALMGFGGVTAVGCSIGQGLSGLSTLALGSVLTTLAIVAGCVTVLRIQMRRA